MLRESQFLRLAIIVYLLTVTLGQPAHNRNELLSRRLNIKKQMRNILSGKTGYIPILSYLRVRGGAIARVSPVRTPTFSTNDPGSRNTPDSVVKPRNGQNWVYFIPSRKDDQNVIDERRRLDLPVQIYTTTQVIQEPTSTTAPTTETTIRQTERIYSQTKTTTINQNLPSIQPLDPLRLLNLPRTPDTSIPGYGIQGNGAIQSKHNISVVSRQNVQPLSVNSSDIFPSNVAIVTPDNSPDVVDILPNNEPPPSASNMSSVSNIGLSRDNVLPMPPNIKSNKVSSTSDDGSVMSLTHNTPVVSQITLSPVSEKKGSVMSLYNVLSGANESIVPDSIGNNQSFSSTNNASERRRKIVSAGIISTVSSKLDKNVSSPFPFNHTVVHDRPSMPRRNDSLVLSDKVSVVSSGNVPLSPTETIYDMSSGKSSPHSHNRGQLVAPVDLEHTKEHIGGGISNYTVQNIAHTEHIAGGGISSDKQSLDLGVGSTDSLIALQGKTNAVFYNSSSRTHLTTTPQDTNKTHTSNTHIQWDKRINPENNFIVNKLNLSVTHNPRGNPLSQYNHSANISTSYRSTTIATTLDHKMSQDNLIKADTDRHLPLSTLSNTKFTLKSKILHYDNKPIPKQNSTHISSQQEPRRRNDNISHSIQASKETHMQQGGFNDTIFGMKDKALGITTSVTPHSSTVKFISGGSLLTTSPPRSTALDTRTSLADRPVEKVTSTLTKQLNKDTKKESNDKTLGSGVFTVRFLDFRYPSVGFKPVVAVTDRQLQTIDNPNINQFNGQLERHELSDTRADNPTVKMPISTPEISTVPSSRKPFSISRARVKFLSNRLSALAGFKPLLVSQSTSFRGGVAPDPSAQNSLHMSPELDILTVNPLTKKEVNPWVDSSKPSNTSPHPPTTSLNTPPKYTTSLLYPYVLTTNSPQSTVISPKAHHKSSVKDKELQHLPIYTEATSTPSTIIVSQAGLPFSDISNRKLPITSTSSNVFISQAGLPSSAKTNNNLPSSQAPIDTSRSLPISLVNSFHKKGNNQTEDVKINAAVDLKPVTSQTVKNPTLKPNNNIPKVMGVLNPTRLRPMGLTTPVSDFSSPVINNMPRPPAVHSQLEQQVKTMPGTGTKLPQRISVLDYTRSEGTKTTNFVNNPVVKTEFPTNTVTLDSVLLPVEQSSYIDQAGPMTTGEVNSFNPTSQSTKMFISQAQPIPSQAAPIGSDVYLILQSDFNTPTRSGSTLEPLPHYPDVHPNSIPPNEILSMFNQILNNMHQTTGRPAVDHNTANHLTFSQNAPEITPTQRNLQLLLSSNSPTTLSTRQIQGMINGSAKEQLDMFNNTFDISVSGLSSNNDSWTNESWAYDYWASDIWENSTWINDTWINGTWENVTDIVETTTTELPPTTTAFGSMNSICGPHLVGHPGIPTTPPNLATTSMYQFPWQNPLHPEYEPPEPSEAPEYEVVPGEGAPVGLPLTPGQCFCMEKAECEGIGATQGLPYEYQCDVSAALSCCCEPS